MRFSVCCDAMRVVRFEQLDDAIELVQQLLEPELVHLVDDDEQHLVVLGPRRARLLQRQQLVDLEIAGVCRGSARIVRHGHDLRSVYARHRASGCRMPRQLSR